MNTKTAWKRFADLPPEAQQQVLDFIAFLQTRYALTRSGKLARTAKAGLKKDTFIGMWRNREDLQDSTAWVRAARASEWMRYRE